MPCEVASNFNTVIQDCVCPRPQYVMEVDTESGFVKRCSADCDANAWPGPIGGFVPACFPCPFEGQIYDYNTIPPSCVCSTTANFITAADQCLNLDFTAAYTNANSQYSNSRANQISYSSIETRNSNGDFSISSITHNSGTIQHYYLDAAVGCTEFLDVQKCQLLANLCVL
jgi:hypothetical protein